MRAEDTAARTAVLVAALLAAGAALPVLPDAAPGQETRDTGMQAGTSAMQAGASAAQARAGVSLRPGVQAEDPPLVEAPFQFRVGPTVGRLIWEHPPGEGSQRMDDAVMWGLDVASVVGRYAGFRLGGAVGPTAIASGGTEFDAVQYLVDVVVEGRLAVGPLYESGVIPFVTVGGGAAVHDPAPDSLITRSQSVFTWGAGLEARLHDRVGTRVEWRRVQAEIQDAADPVDRTGTTRFADRVYLGLYWEF